MFYVFKGLSNFLDEIESYRWAEGTKETPVKEYDHLMDALRYAIISIRHNRIVVPVTADQANPWR